MTISLLLLVYYSSMTAGITAGGYKLLRQIRFFEGIEDWVLLILGFSLFPVLAVWLGFTGIFRIPFLPEMMGLLLTAYGASQLYLNKAWLDTLWKKILSERLHIVSVIICLLLVVAYVVTKYCYFLGGSNNFPWDEQRSYVYTTMLAANYLKPAYVGDLSIPSTYSYYLFAYTGFLYLAVDGFSSPSILMLLASIISIAVYYLAFIKFILALTQRHIAWIILSSILCITFYGWDSVTPGGGDWWNTNEVISMGHRIQYFYPYFWGGSFALIAFHQLFLYLKNTAPNRLIIAAMALGLSFTYSTLVGAFACLSVGIWLITILLENPRQGYDLLKRVLPYIDISIVVFLIILGPQIVTLLSRGDYLIWLNEPVMWFERVKIFKATSKDWLHFADSFMLELGIFHTAAIIVYFLYAADKKLLRSQVSLFFISQLIAILLCACFVESRSWDWRWHSTGFAITWLSSLMLIYLLDVVILPRNIMRTGLHVLIYASLIPGAYAYVIRQMEAFRDCRLPPGYAWELNKKVNLHDPIITNIAFPHDVFWMGRMAKDQKVFDFWRHQSASNEFYEKLFRWDKKSPICGSTWYGRAAPNHRYVELKNLEPLELENKTCPQPD